MSSSCIGGIVQEIAQLSERNGSLKQQVAQLQQQIDENNDRIGALRNALGGTVAKAAAIGRVHDTDTRAAAAFDLSIQRASAASWSASSDGDEPCTSAGSGGRARAKAAARGRKFADRAKADSAFRMPKERDQPRLGVPDTAEARGAIKLLKRQLTNSYNDMLRHQPHMQFVPHAPMSDKQNVVVRDMLTEKLLSDVPQLSVLTHEFVHERIRNLKNNLKLPPRSQEEKEHYKKLRVRKTKYLRRLAVIDMMEAQDDNVFADQWDEAKELFHNYDLCSSDEEYYAEDEPDRKRFRPKRLRFLNDSVERMKKQIYEYDKLYYMAPNAVKRHVELARDAPVIWSERTLPAHKIAEWMRCDDDDEHYHYCDAAPAVKCDARATHMFLLEGEDNQ